MSQEKDWIDILSAFSVPIIAAVGVGLGIFNYRLAQRKRKDELFDRRYEFYKKLENFWFATAETSQDPNHPHFGPAFLDLDEFERIEIIEGWVHRARFLFGEDIETHIRSLANKEYQGIDRMPDEGFSKPFDRYLKFED